MHMMIYPELRAEDADYFVLPSLLWPRELPLPTSQMRARPFHVAKVLANRAADRGVFVLQQEDARILFDALAAAVADGGLLDQMAGGAR